MVCIIDGLCNDFIITSLALFFLIIVPSGYPHSFEATAASSTSAIITWDPPLPEEQNGIIIGYIINVTVAETGERFQLFSNSTSITVDTLQPFTTYLCIIAARTVIGTGPFSTVITLETPEDGKWDYFYST